MNRPNRQNGSPALRVAVAAPFPEIVRIHESTAEYADELEVCAMISNPDAVLEQARLLQPDVLLLSDGLGPARSDTLARLTAVAPATRLVMLATGAATAQPFIADGVVEFNASAAELRAAIVGAIARGGAAQPASSQPATAADDRPNAAAPGDSEPGADDPAAEERAPGRIVLVFSGKGGVGKSIIATNLATLLAQRGARVAIVDLNLQYGDIGVLLHLEGHPVTIDAVAKGGPTVAAADLERALATTEQGVRVLLAPASPESSDLVSPAGLEAILTLASRTYDYVVVDSAAHLEERIVGVMEVADHILLVSSFGITSIKDTKVTLRLLQSVGIEPDRVALIVNQVRQRVSFPAEEIARAVRFPILSTLPYEPRMEESVDSGRPLVVTEPRSGFARQLAAVVEELARARHPTSAPKVRRHAARWRLRFGHRSASVFGVGSVTPPTR